MTSKTHTSPTLKILGIHQLLMRIILRINIKGTNTEAISRKLPSFSKTKIHLWLMTNILGAIGFLTSLNVGLMSTSISQLLYNNLSWEWKSKWTIHNSSCALTVHPLISKYATLVEAKEQSLIGSSAKNNNAVDVMGKDLVINASIAMANLMCQLM